MSERETALMEAHCIQAEDEYFKARPQIDNTDRRRVYQSGFKSAWQARAALSIEPDHDTEWEQRWPNAESPAGAAPLPDDVRLMDYVEHYAKAMKLSSQYGNEYGDMDAANNAWYKCKETADLIERQARRIEELDRAADTFYHALENARARIAQLEAETRVPEQTSEQWIDANVSGAKGLVQAMKNIAQLEGGEYVLGWFAEQPTGEGPPIFCWGRQKPSTDKNWQALIATPQPEASRVPEGWQLVPVTPTDAMRDAGNEVIKNRGMLIRAWCSMLAAAPHNEDEGRE